MAMATTSNELSTRQQMTTEELVAFAEAALAETALKQRAALQGGGKLPFGFGSQPGDTLDLSDKGISVLPVELIDLVKDRVERLSLGHNRLAELPAEIIFCSNLLYLNLRHNQLDEIPEPVLHLRSLQIVDLSYNNISSLPDNIKTMHSLMFLAIESNQIRRLPLCLGDMSRLMKLKISANPIEFPPPQVFVPQFSASLGEHPVEEARQICTQVKTYLRDQSALEQGRREASSAEPNEQHLETPRPIRRTMSGRFPVRPSISGIEGIEKLRINTDTTSSHHHNNNNNIQPAPPIPQKSRARDSMILPPPVSRRPSVGPITMERSRSETVGPSVPRSRRLGYVPRKPTTVNNSALTDMGTLRAVSYKPSGHPSHAVHAVQSGNESSSGAISPVEDGNGRLIVNRRRLSSLPEDRRVSKPTCMTVKITMRIVFALYQLNGSIGDAVRIIKNGTPRKTVVEKYYFECSNQLEELDRRLNQILQDTGQSKASEQDPWILGIRRKSGHVIAAYAHLAGELRLLARKIALRGEAMYLRNLMLQIYGALVEMRNALSFLATEVIPVRTPVKAARTSLAASSSRSVTPTQSKPFPKKRLRGATLVQPAKLTTPGSVAPPVPLSTSRSNTMTSMSAATPRSGESFSFAGMNATPMSRSNTQNMHSMSSEESEEQRQFESIYLKLQNACELAAQTLPGCRVDFFSRSESAHRSMQPRVASHWTLVLQKCDATINVLEVLRSRLSMMKLKEPGLRGQRDFWQLCDSFVRAWTDLASEIKNVGQQGYETDSIKVVMRPVQKAVKDVGLALHASQLYQNAHRSNLPASYVTPLPATPLSAALGPAALATVPSTPNSIVTPIATPVEYFGPGFPPLPQLSNSGYISGGSRDDAGTARYRAQSRGRS